MNRFFTHGELATEYRLPQHIHEQLLADIATVEKNDQGEPLFLEAHVDAWLAARSTVTPWRAPMTEAVKKDRPSTTPTKANEDQESFVTVAEAQRRFLDGKMSRKWWYRLAQTGQIAHYRVGDKILFRTEDIEQFVAESRRAEHVDGAGAEPAPFLPNPPQRPATKRPGDPVGGFKFFPRK
jgi:hypothetical protein